MTININNDCSSISSNSKHSQAKNQQTFKIQKVLDIPQRTDVTNLEFPNWLQGSWQFLNFTKGQLVYRDQNSFKSFRMTLVNQLGNEKFIVLSRSQCGEESFKCLWIKKMHDNVLEIQTSSESPLKLTSDHLCNAEYFESGRWLTQASEYQHKILW